MILFDAGTQVSLISHQTIIYAINPQMRSSLNSVFMTFLFLCFALGSAISNRMFGTFGWPGVLGFALTTTVLALAMSFVRVRNTNIQK
jgi:predicted MFS family arabinose efflux permease